MIYNMHVRHDWDRLFVRNDGKTVSTLCGRRTRNNLAGIPGITEGQDFAPKKDSRGPRYPWCHRCMRKLFREHGSAYLLFKDSMPYEVDIMWDRIGQALIRYGKMVSNVQ